MPGYGSFARYRGPFFGDNDQDQQREPDADADEGAPSAMPGMQFMPASPEQTSMYDPNQGDEAALRQWLEDNVYSQGWTADFGTGEIYDPQTDTVKGRIPSFYPRT